MTSYHQTAILLMIQSEKSWPEDKFNLVYVRLKRFLAYKDKRVKTPEESERNTYGNV